MCMFKMYALQPLVSSLYSSLQPRRHTELCDLSLRHHVAWDLRWNAEDSDLHVQVRDTVIAATYVYQYQSHHMGLIYFP